MADTTPPLSTRNSPLMRSSSPSPSVSPSLALGACPLLDRSVSTASTVSALSSRSVSSASDGSSAVVRRRGYMRPQGTGFADSARNRDSVMSLGSIAHMQYYFARTGLLDGKGAQLAKARKSMSNRGDEDDVTIMDPEHTPSTDGHLTPNEHDSDYFAPNKPLGHGQEEADPWNGVLEPAMLPPTVSTYKHKPDYSLPLPDITVLRRELREALEDARKVLEETSTDTTPAQDQSSLPSASGSPKASEDQGWHELQGMHILDIVTLAIRAAKQYYTCHNNPQKLYEIQSERSIRTELYQCLDLLKRTANRGFHGGMREAEKKGLLDWIASIHNLLSKEEMQEAHEQILRDQWIWLQGDWQGQDRERELSFLRSFDADPASLPEWHHQVHGTSTFLEALRDGTRLIRLHNEFVRQSRRRFGEIKTYHTDVGKPYRCADNLRYWLKAAELRWEVKLDLNVLDVVYGKGDATWEVFEQAVLTWCRTVREELSGEWLGTDGGQGTLPPHIHVEAED